MGELCYIILLDSVFKLNVGVKPWGSNLHAKKKRTKSERGMLERTLKRTLSFCLKQLLLQRDSKASRKSASHTT